MSGDERESAGTGRAPSGDGTVVRVWHGWTEPEDAEAYETFLSGDEGLLETLDIDGYLGYDLLRRDDGDEVEFVTQLRFGNDDAVEAFAGENTDEAHIPEPARKLLTRWEDEALHYEERASERR